MWMDGTSSDLRPGAVLCRAGALVEFSAARFVIWYLFSTYAIELRKRISDEEYTKQANEFSDHNP